MTEWRPEKNSLLQENPWTAYELAVALETSDDLERAITVDTCLDELTSCGKKNGAPPWKDLVSILQRLRMQTKSQFKQRITSWTEAEEWLASAACRCALERIAEKEQKSLETFKRHMAKTTEALARRFRMKNFKIRSVPATFKKSQITE
jgi:hypothetical protein